MILSPLTRYVGRFVAIAYVVVLVVVPVGLIAWRTFEPGFGAFVDSITTPAAISALQLSLLVVAIVVPLNVIFGVPTALLLARKRFRGKAALQAVIDLPFAVSPVVVGVALILLWGTAGLLGVVENDLGLKIIFGLPGIVLMENAGRNAAALLHDLAPGAAIAIVCGRGNNAGDGFVMARHLELAGHAVRLLMAADPARLTGDAATNHRVAVAAGIAYSSIAGNDNSSSVGDVVCVRASVSPT